MKCPDFEQLLNYVDNDLSGPESAQIASHLASGCPQCSESRAWYEQIRLITSTDDSIEPPAWIVKRAIKVPDTKSSRPKISERLAQMIAALVFDSQAGAALA